ncbi:hypothetical protein [Lysinibacillus sp. NPDC093216]|uniref:hypothetical protein n=1 Tax=Lysinibacillus sp. NPDC093216 TaxID=3390576 RepID=UPI003D01360F
MDHHHNVWLISVPAGRFVAAAAFAQIKHLPLTLRFRAEQSFLGASDEPLIPKESPSLHSNQLIYSICFNKRHPQLLVINQKYVFPFFYINNNIISFSRSISFIGKKKYS